MQVHPIPQLISVLIQPVASGFDRNLQTPPQVGAGWGVVLVVLPVGGDVDPGGGVVRWHPVMAGVQSSATQVGGSQLQPANPFVQRFSTSPQPNGSA